MSIYINKLQVSGNNLDETIESFKRKLESVLLPVFSEEFTTKEIDGQKYMYLNGQWTLQLDEVVVTAKKYKNVRGFVKAERGIRLRKGDQNYIGEKGDVVYGSASEVLVLHRGKNQNANWLRIKTFDNTIGWIEKQFIQVIPIDPFLDGFTKKFYYIKSGAIFEKDIAQIEYGNYKISTGNDYRTLAQAFYLLNQQAGLDDGITIKNSDSDFLSAIELGYKASIDPAFTGARNLYKQLFLNQNYIVRLPNEKYIQLQQEVGNLSKRSDFVNTTIDVGDAIVDAIAGTAGVIVGILEGIFRGIYDALEGIVDLIGIIIKTIKSLVEGTLFDKLKDLFETIIKLADLEWEKLKEVLYAILGNIGDTIKDTIENWNKASAFEKGRVIGIMVGAILLEILIAIFTGGSVTAAKWAGKLGKLGKVLNKVAEIGDQMRDALKKNKKLKKLFEKGDYKNDKDDGKNWQRWALLQQARTTAEIMDDNGSTFFELQGALELSAKLYPDLENVKWPFSKKGDIYSIGMKASDEKWVDKHFTSGDGENKKTFPSNKIDSNNKPKGKSTKIDKKDDFETRRGLTRENESADILARNGYDIEQTPKIEGITKRPDYLIEGKIFDNYAPSGKNARNIASNIQEKIDDLQTERVVLNLKDSDVELSLLTKQLKDYPIDGLKEIIIIDKNSKVINYYPF